VIEKDLLRGKIRSAIDFIAHTSHDTQSSGHKEQTHRQKEKSTVLGMEATLEESKERRACIQKKWESIKNRSEKKNKENSDDGLTVREVTLKDWVKTFPIINECTHFGCIMDLKTGTVRWLERGIEEEWE
jgi:hypothetical protein